jgi:selenide,water dikinase
VVTHPDVLVDAGSADDAAVFRVAPDRALVLTTDFFTPIVDDPYDFGRIAAANALSDVYAMGGRPLYCLSLVGWPRDKLPLEVLGEVVRGASEVVAAAGAAIVGGHSIDDPEPKFGLVAVGEVDPGRMTTNAALRAGDALVLTKPLGTGIIATAIKRGVAPEAVVREAVNWMTTLNADAAAAAAETGVKTATDVTGFGLLGHLGSMLRASGCGADVYAESVVAMTGAAELYRAGCVPGGTTRNIVAARGFTTFEPGVSEWRRALLSDAQTSGGLLLGVPQSSVATLLDRLSARGVRGAAVIGAATGAAAGTIRVLAR